jgi:hypothetical protein
MRQPDFPVHLFFTMVKKQTRQTATPAQSHTHKTSIVNTAFEVGERDGLSPSRFYVAHADRRGISLWAGSAPRPLSGAGRSYDEAIDAVIFQTDGGRATLQHVCGLLLRRAIRAGTVPPEHQTNTV